MAHSCRISSCCSCASSCPRAMACRLQRRRASGLIEQRIGDGLLALFRARILWSKSRVISLMLPCRASPAWSPGALHHWIAIDEPQPGYVHRTCTAGPTPRATHLVMRGGSLCGPMRRRKQATQRQRQSSCLGGIIKKMLRHCQASRMPAMHGQRQSGCLMQEASRAASTHNSDAPPCWRPSCPSAACGAGR